MKAIVNKPLQIVATLYGILYFLGFALPILMGEYTADKFENISVLSMFFLFTIGLIFSWFNEKIGGLLFQVWYLFIWVLGFFFWPDAGMVLVLSLPIFFTGIFMYQNDYKNAGKESLTKQQIKKHLIVVLMLNYGVLYAAMAIPKLFLDFNKYMELPFIIFPLLFLLFIISFIISWKKEKSAGIILILWYLTLALSSITSDEFFNEAPSVAMGLTLLIQGILYLKYYNKKKKLRRQIS